MRSPESTHQAPDASQSLFTSVEWAAIKETLRLSPRESDIILGLLAGETETTIAERLGISIHTVHCHLARSHRKLEVQNRSALFVKIFSTYRALSQGSISSACV